MIDDDSYIDLPEDPELAFIKLTQGYIVELNDRESGDFDTRIAYKDYIVKTLAADEALGLDRFVTWEVPSDPDEIYPTFAQLSSEVLRVTTSTRIRLSRRRKNFSVPLDTATREKIHHHISKLTEIAQKLEIDEDKRDSIVAKLHELTKEIDRSRTRLEVVGEFLVTTATYVGEAGEKLEPWRKWIDSIAGLIGKAREAEVQQPQLPSPRKPKQIEGPKNLEDSEGSDDIPF